MTREQIRQVRYYLSKGLDPAMIARHVGAEFREVFRYLNSDLIRGLCSQCFQPLEKIRTVKRARVGFKCAKCKKINYKISAKKRKERGLTQTQ